MRLPVRLRYMVRAEHCQAALALGKLRPSTYLHK